MGRSGRRKFNPAVSRSHRRQTMLGWLVVAAAAVVAVGTVLLINQLNTNTGGQSSAASQGQGPAGAPGAPSAHVSLRSFRYCADRHASFKDSRAFVGLSDPFVETSGAGRGCAFGLLASHHVGYFRGTLSWAGVESTKGQYNFGFYDKLIAALAQHHMRFLPGLLLSPGWASSGPPGSRLVAAYPPANPSDFAAFVAVCVRRYGPGGSFWHAHPGLPYYPITAWQVWNEPNLVQYWQPRPDPAAYVRLLHAAHVAIRRADPHAIVVAAGMPFFTAGKERSFLGQLFAAGMAGNFEVLSVHSFSPIQAPARLELARQIMDRHGAGSAALWSTELAWASGPPDPWAVNPSTQASAITSFASWVARNRTRLNLGEIFWYSLRDRIYGPDPSWWGWHLGLLSLSQRPKPAFPALTAAAARLNQ